MADQKISALPAVSTPAGTDEFAINQSGTTKKMTLTQLLAAGVVPGLFSTLASSGGGSLGGDALASALTLDLNTAAGYLRSVVFQTGGVDRWSVRAEATAEGGSDAGSDFELVALDDSGVEVGDALKITRADMSTVFGGSVRIPLLGIGAPSVAGKGIYVAPTSLTGTSQIGADLAPIISSAATVAGYAIQAQIATAVASFTCPEAAGVVVKDASKGAGSTITELIGLLVEAQTQGATNYAIKTEGSAKSLFGGEVEIDGDLNHDGTNYGLCGATPSAPQTGYTTFSNLSTDRTCDADTVAVAELADIVGTLIVDLKTKGIISA
jgi:hypothetical protein